MNNVNNAASSYSELVPGETFSFQGDWCNSVIDRLSFCKSSSRPSLAKPTCLLSRLYRVSNPSAFPFVHSLNAENFRERKWRQFAKTIINKRLPKHCEGRVHSADWVRLKWNCLYQEWSSEATTSRLLGLHEKCFNLFTRPRERKTFIIESKVSLLGFLPL